jgi:hypothetical protein
MKPILLACFSILSFAVFSTRPAAAAPITGGTIFLDPDIVTAADASAFSGLSYAGTGDVVMFDRRLDAFSVFKAFLFDVTFTDGLTTQIQVNPEFGTPATAHHEAEKYGSLIGQLPTSLRVDVDTVWIHKGLQPFGGRNQNILIHTDMADDYAAGGFLEEALVHEGAHTSLDAAHAVSPGWLAAQAADADFISTWAVDHPTQEDVAESFLTWLAVRYRSERISPVLAAVIEGTIPNRLAYFDVQQIDLFPAESATLSPARRAPRPLTGHRGDCASALSADLEDSAPGHPLRRTRPGHQQTVAAGASTPNDPRTPKPRLPRRATHRSSRQSSVT